MKNFQLEKENKFLSLRALNCALKFEVELFGKSYREFAPTKYRTSLHQRNQKQAKWQEDSRKKEVAAAIHLHQIQEKKYV